MLDMLEARRGGPYVDPSGMGAFSVSLLNG